MSLTVTFCFPYLSHIMELHLLGGFLGSGKTTAIRQAVSLLVKEGRSVAVITNDQGNELVDSVFLRSTGTLAGEVTGGCFCCHYRDFTGIIDTLPQMPEILFAEAVGSCADLVATVIRPLLRDYPGWVIKFTVMADAAFLLALFREQCAFIKEEVRYIYQKQLEEAGMIVVNKADLLSEDEQAWLRNQLEPVYPGKSLVFQNSLNETSVAHWLKALDDALPAVNLTSLDIDYHVYGSGEASMAWLDEELSIKTTDRSAALVSGWLMDQLYRRVLDAQLMIGHLKFLLQCGGRQYKISYTHFGSTSDRSFTYYENGETRLLVNARIQGTPAQLEGIVTRLKKDCIERFDCQVERFSFNSFQPGFPQPQYRLSR